MLSTLSLLVLSTSTPVADDDPARTPLLINQEADKDVDTEQPRPAASTQPAQCRSCGCPNPTTPFCRQCGQRATLLPTACPSCRQPNPTAPHCSACGHAIPAT